MAILGACGRSSLNVEECDDFYPCEGLGGAGGGRAGASPGGKASAGSGGTVVVGGVAGQGALGGMGGAGKAGAAAAGGASGMGGGAAGAAGQPGDSLYCEQGQQAVLYLLHDDSVLRRIDADTLMPLTQLQLGLDRLNSLAVTDGGVVYVARDLELYRVDAFTGQAVSVGLDVTGFNGDDSLTIGFAPRDAVVAGPSLFVVHANPGGVHLLYAAPLDTFEPVMRKALTQLNEYPEILSTPEGRVFAMVAQGFVEYDPFTFAELGTLPIPGIAADWAGDSAYLSGYLFGAYAQNGTSRVYRAQVMPDLPGSPLVTLTDYPAKVVGTGAACELPR